MAFTLCEKDNIQWVTSDVLGTKHLFSRRLGDVGDFPFSSKPDPEWESESRQERVRALWQRFRTAAEFPAEGFCFTRQVHGTVLRYVTEAERAMPPLPHPPEDCDGLITDRKDVPLCVWTADCVPVLFRDPKAGHRCRRAQRLEGDGRRYDGLDCPPHGGHGRESGEHPRRDRPGHIALLL